MPFWYKLIYNWVENHGRNGLTLPYILGAIEYESGCEVGNDDIIEFINRNMLGKEVTEPSFGNIIKEEFILNLNYL